MKNIKKISFYISLIALALFTSCGKDTPNDDPNSNESSFDFIDLAGHLDGATKTIFLNENEGWVLGVKDGESLKRLLYTDNGGNSWTIKKAELSASRNQIQFVNSTDGYLLDNYGVRYTTDKGASWTDMIFPNPDNDQLLFYATASNSTTTVMLAWVNTDYSALFFVSNATHNVTNTVPINEMIIPGHNMHLSENGAIIIAPTERAGHSLKEIAYSADDGASWNYTEILSEGELKTESWVCDMSFPDDNTGFFTGRDNGYDKAYVYKTANGGSSWTKISIPGSILHYNFNQISFANANYGLGIGMGSIHKTTDGGETWTEFSYYSDNYISTGSVSYPEQDHGFILGLNGADTDFSYRIYKYTDQ